MELRVRRDFLLFACVLAILSAGCTSKPPAEAAYNPVPEAVGIDLTLERGSPDLATATKWLGSHTSGGHAAKFLLEFDAAQESTSPIKIRFGKGRFVPVPGSDATGLLGELKTALGAKLLPAQVTRSEYVPFDYAIIGGKSYRLPDGSFTEKRSGNWVTMKLFLGDDDGEVFLNLNPVLNKAELSLKDPDYGDFVVAQLAKVL